MWLLDPPFVIPTKKIKNCQQQKLYCSVAKPQELIFKHPLKQETVSLTRHALRIQVIHLMDRAIASTTAGINMNAAVPIAHLQWQLSR